MTDVTTDARPSIGFIGLGLMGHAFTRRLCARGYEVTGCPVDPNPPAFLRGSQMKVGNGAGLVNAAEHSPALRLCGPEGTGPTDPTDPT